MNIDLLNGNGQRYITGPLKIVILSEFINDVALKHWEEYADIKIKRPSHFTYEIEPENATQIVRILTLASTFCWEVCYTDNASTQSTIYLRTKERE